MSAVYRHFGLFAVVLGAVLFMGVWFASPDAASPAAMPPIKDSWNLSTDNDRDREQLKTALSSRNLWGASKLAARRHPWRVTGIVSQGKERYVMVNYEDRPVAMLKEGDNLPDGAKITHIGRGRFLVLTPDNKKISYGLNEE